MASALCQAGVKAIAILDVLEEVGNAAVKELHEVYGVPAARFYKVDVRDADAISNVVKDVVETFGSVDILLNSAGIAE
jgi:sorbose reductase